MPAAACRAMAVVACWSNAGRSSAMGTPVRRGAGGGEPADLRFGPDDALVAEQLEGLANRGPADVVLGRQSLLARQLLGHASAAAEAAAQLLGEPLVGQVGGVGGARDVAASGARDDV